mmetsp:Transcript_2152/g.5025  ORF Transcript_2152/g.5025 Transcript_2152/m.5025 type:complete len:234 (-) Transcript_2152:329-1030(-)|eukprot:CAMPEP_0178987256 /NCGR_PEP_ID=MMETSP0795-20121207/3163_1 /TAXON_ID=88552 /ORGANISM="Amoebophrya sp., Strain Ameob2" /LENGTH=233 /DNA_ID=CAMNT_0020678417 /DNA_START=76 /DNA_END=777 /DNA_ORIENTATION=-
MLDALGKHNVGPTCSKKSHPLASYNQRAHFQIGVEDDTSGRKTGSMHAAFPDPEVVYMRYIPPDKNASTVGLTQGETGVWQSEQHGRYVSSGPQKRRDAFPGANSVVHFGDDPAEKQSQYTFTHAPGQDAKDMPPNACKWPHWPENNVITGAIRTDLEPRSRRGFGCQNLKSNDHSHIENDNTKIRNPLTGSFNTRPAHEPKTSHQYVQSENKTIHPLISAGSIRQRTATDRM